MKSVTKLKDDARKHEQREEWDQAIQAYLQVLKIGEEGEGELDLPLYNRVGDLYLRLNRPNDAVKYYVQAADRYAEAGLFNNAIALCNKALRYVPQQLDLLRKLGQFSASQGFLTDARRYFLEFAEKKFAAGQVADALTSLEEFAEASDDPEIRVMLARQLHAHSRTAEAVDEMKKAHAVYVRDGDQGAAGRLHTEIEALSPGAMSAASTVAATPYAEAPAEAVAEDYAFTIDSGEVTEPPPAADPDAGLVDIAAGGLEGFESTQFEIATEDTQPELAVQGFESTTLDEPDAFAIDDADVDDLGLEPTTFESFGTVEAVPLAGLEVDEPSLGGDIFADSVGGDAGVDDSAGLEDSTFDLPLLSPEGEDAFALDGANDSDAFDLPAFEIEVPEAGDGAAEGDGYFDDVPALDLPMLGGDESMDDVFEDAPVETRAEPMFSLEDVSVPPEHAAPAVRAEPAGTAHISPDMDFGEYGLEPPPLVLTGRREDVAAIEEALDMSAEAPTPEDAAAAEFVEELVAESESTATGVTEELHTEPVSRNGERESAVLEAPEALEHAAPATPVTPAVPARPASRPADSGFIDLGALIAEDDDEAQAGTRFVVQERAPTGDEDRDFAELLSQFKQKVSEHVSTEDSAAHYDLGLAFKEMGLVDEAIGEFQIAMRSGDMRLRVYEELGQCFLLKGQHNIAEKVLRRALEMKSPGGDIEMVGVYYHLGRAYEGLGNRDAARDAYERVLGIDVNFQDVTARLGRL